VGDFIHSIRFDSQRCKGRMACMRVCPTEAIRVRNGHASMLEDRCIDCGECLTICPSGAVVPLTNSFVDFSRFRHTIVIPTPSFYVQFGLNVAPETLVRGLLEIGFDSFYDVSLVCEATGMAISEFLDRYDGPLPLITPFCPTVVRLMQLKFPDISGLLMPIESPMETAALEAKEEVAAQTGLPLEDIGTIYLTPCPVKMIAIQHHPRKAYSYIDGAIAISDIYQPLLAALQKLPHNDEEKREKVELSAAGLGWGRPNGLTRSLGSEDILFVSGLNNVISIFEEIERGHLKDIKMVECHTCWGGCIGGSLLIENSYVSRHRMQAMQARLGWEPKVDREDVSKRFKEGYYTVDQALPTSPFKPLDKDFAKAIEKMKQIEELHQILPGIDCGVCGAPTCQAFAEDVVLGRAEVSDCVFEQRKQIEGLLRQSLDCLAGQLDSKEG